MCFLSHCIRQMTCELCRFYNITKYIQGYLSTMGCFSSREEKSVVRIKASPLDSILNALGDNLLTDTIVLKSTLLSYRYSREEQAWILRRRKALFSINSLFLLEKETRQATSHENMIASFDVPVHQCPFVIRPPSEAVPIQLLEEHDDLYLKGLAKRIVTSVQVGDQFPAVIVSRTLFHAEDTKFSIAGNGKFTFVLSWSYGSQSSQQQFKRFLQLYKHRWSRIVPEEMREFYGLCRGSSAEESMHYERLAKKYKWENQTHLYTGIDVPTTQYFSSGQVFNILPDDLQLSQEDVFVIISPTGKVVLAERANFKIELQRQHQQSDLASVSEGSQVSNEISNTQHSHQIQFEKGVEKELKNQMKQYKADRLSQGTRGSVTLSKKQLVIMNILQKLQVINRNQHKDFKNFFMSPELAAFLSQKLVGEQFQIELERWVIFGKGDLPNQFKEVNRLYLVPSVYPACSPQKEHFIPQIIQELQDNIPLVWRTPSMTAYTIPREHTIVKKILLEELHRQLQEIDLGFLELFVQKDRRFEWHKKPSGNALVNCERYVKKEWISCQQVEKSIQFSSHITKVDNVPVGFEGYKNYAGMIELAAEAFQAKENPDNASIQFQGLDPITFQLMTEFYLMGVSTEVRVGAQYEPIPQCYQLKSIFDSKLQQDQDDQVDQIPFIQGHLTLIYLIEWESDIAVDQFGMVYQTVQQYIDMDFNQHQALSGLSQFEQPAHKLRLVVLGNNSQTAITTIQAAVQKALKVSTNEEINSLGLLEFWMPINDYYQDSQEYLYQGLLCKFFGLEADCNNMLFFSGNAQLLFRGSAGQGFTVALTAALQGEPIQYVGTNKENFFKQFPDVTQEDSNWKTIKQYFRKNKSDIDQLFFNLNKSSNEGAYFVVESTKYKVWDSHKNQFKDYSSKVNLSYELDENSKAQLNEVIEAFKVIF